MIYGYIRTKSKRQSVTIQKNHIKHAYPSAIVYVDEYNADPLFRTNRPDWRKLQHNLLPGDTIVMESIAFLGDTPSEIIQNFRNLHIQYISLIFLQEQHLNSKNLNRIYMNHIDSYDLLWEVFENQILATLRQIDNNYDLKKRQIQDGIKKAKGKGVPIGGKPGMQYKTKKADMAKQKILEYSKDFNGSFSDSECMERIGLSRNTFYKYKRELKQKIGHKKAERR